MYEIKRNTRIVMDSDIETWSREICHANILEVEAGTNGLHGGDAGHGSRAFLRIKDLGGTCMDAVINRDSWGNAEEIAISLGGDAEICSFISALKFAIKVLEEATQNDPGGYKCK